MKDEKKTKARLIEELTALRSSFAELQASYQAVSEEKKRADEDFRRYRDFVENAADACFEVDLNGQYIFFNDALCRHSGYTREELSQGIWREQLASKETIRNTVNLYQQVLHTGIPAQIVTHELRKKDGAAYSAELSVSLARDLSGKPTGYRVISRDVTERVKMEKDLERYREFLENIDDSCYETDIKGKLIFVNEAMCHHSGYTRDELYETGSTVHYISLDERRRVARVFNEIYHTGVSGKVVVQYLNKGGKAYYVENSVSLMRDAKGHPIGFRGIGRDITERMIYEAQQERYRNFFENIDDICFENDLNGTVTFFNKAMCNILNLSPEELHNINHRQLYSEETAAKIYPIYNEIYRTGKSTRLYDFEITRMNGESRFLDITVGLIRDADGQPIGFRGVARDVTQRKQMEDEQKSLREKLTQSEKLESIGTLAGGIAHDFNNLLMGIQGYTSLILMDIDAGHPFYESLKIIESQVKSGADLTKQLLGYARGGRYEMKVMNMNEFIKKTSYMFGRTKKDIRIHHNYAKALWNIEADRGQMEQVFINLFVNASEAMPAGGSIYLQTENVLLDEPYVKAHDAEPGRYIKVSVADTGFGMDGKIRERIFEPFFTTKDMSAGAGLGLASVYGIIKGHRGIINCYSEKGHGTTFSIYLPAAPEAETKASEQAAAAVEKKIRILLVDDEKTITDVTGTMLRKLGHRVMIAQGGEEAVMMYRMNRDHVDLVVMDMIMPDMNGGEAIEKIKAINPHAKVLLSSGYSINGMARKIMDRCGVEGFLQKPFQVDQLVGKINEVMGVENIKHENGDF